MFVSKLSDADGEGAETQVWIDFAHACGYITETLRHRWLAGYEEVGRMLGVSHPERFK
jgi:four helix bundle protein